MNTFLHVHSRIVMADAIFDETVSVSDADLKCLKWCVCFKSFFDLVEDSMIPWVKLY